MKSKIINIVVTALVLMAAIAIWAWRTHDDCPSLCRASSVARQAKETMSLVEAMMHLPNDGSSTKDFKNAEELTSYRSPYVERWRVEDDGSIVLVGSREGFMLALRPVSKGGWQCLGFPEKILVDIKGFMDARSVSECKLSGK